MYSKNRKIGRPNNLKVFESKKTPKGLNRILCLREENLSFNEIIPMK
jgi:hypothetical protein